MPSTSRLLRTWCTTSKLPLLTRPTHSCREYNGPEQGYAKRSGALQGSNSRAIAERAKQLVGWEDTADVYAYLDGDVKDAVREWKESA
jgi:hypothetical protein